ncbi:zinc finger Y-chromosomal protein 2-like isoform X2 [Euwallacea fornicatus]|uniref:zinc finger Y-chromosomal protein 2-like isoform X2 n=1 Tax=Euwallacea fornicatus TaxID=995702 RepID=UPI00338D7C2E
MLPITCKKSDVSINTNFPLSSSAPAITDFSPDLLCSPITSNPKGKRLCKTLVCSNPNSSEILMETSIDLTTEDCDRNESPQKMSPLMRKFILVPLKLAVPYLLGRRELKNSSSLKHAIEIDLTVDLNEEPNSKVNNEKIDLSSQSLHECTLSEICLPPKTHSKRHDLETDFSIEGEDFKDEPELVSVYDISKLAQDSMETVIVKYQEIRDKEIPLGSTNTQLKSTSIHSELLAKDETFERPHVVEDELNKDISEDTQNECDDSLDLEIKIEYPEPLEEMLNCTTGPDLRDKGVASEGQNIELSISNTLFETEIFGISQNDTNSPDKITPGNTQTDCEKLADMEIKIEDSEAPCFASPKNDSMGEISGLSQNSDIAVVDPSQRNNLCDSEVQETKKTLFGSSETELNLLPTSTNMKTFKATEMGPSSNIYVSNKEGPEPDFEIKIEYPELLKDPQNYELQYSQITDHRNAKFQCETCPYETDESVHFEVHKKTHRYSYNCPQCLYKTCKKAKLQHHIYCKHTPMEDKLIYCGDCEFTCLTRVGMADHRRKMHKRLPRPPNKCFLERKPKLSSHPCGVCARSFQTAKGALDHQATHIYSKIESGALKCLTCDFVSARTDMINHYFDVHKKGEKKHRCEKCYYGTNFKSYLTKHFKSHAHLENVRKAQVVQI